MVANQEPARKPIPKRMRFEIMRRDGNACRYCGGMAPDVKLTLDHVLPVALGGTDDPSNLVTACADCNAGKSSSSPDQTIVAQVSDDARRWANAVKASAMVLEQETDALNEYVVAFDDEWGGWHYGNGKPIPRDPNWRFSVEQFHKRSMPINVLISSARIALGNDRIELNSKWRYFMGVAWKKMSEIEELAKRVYDAQSADESADE